MQPVTIKKEDNKVTIFGRGQGKKFEPEFFKAIVKYVKEGYDIPSSPKNDEVSLRNFRGVSIGRCVLVKEDASVNSTPDKKIEKETTPQKVEQASENSEDSTKKKAGRPPKNKK